MSHSKTMLQAQRYLRSWCLLAVLISFFGFSSISAIAQPNQTSPLGINLAGVSYYTPEQPFLDIFKTAYTEVGWLTQAPGIWHTNEQQWLPLDANGWVTSLTRTDGGVQTFDRVGVLILRSLVSPYYPSGSYVVLYDGEGTIVYGFDAVKNRALSAPGRDVFNVATPSAAGVWIAITATDPKRTGNYIRNIRVVKAENETLLRSGKMFNPDFLSRISPFSTIRFMDWMNTNFSNQSAWNNRPKPTDAFWSSPSGVPVEVMVALSNQLGASAWFNMPYMATDDYVTQFATYVHQNLGSNQRVYVEYSNEFWNGAFPSGAWMQTQGHITWPSVAVDFNLTANYYGMRTAQVCDLWKSAWGADASRVTCVIGQQTWNWGVASAALACQYWTQRPCASNHGITALAIAGYFGPLGPIPSFWLTQSDGGLTSLYNAFLKGGVDPASANGYINDALKVIAANKANVADPYGLEIVGYEGGPGLQSSDPGTGKLYTAFSVDPRMQTVYTTFLNQWKAAGYLHTMNHFNDAMTPQVQYGLWGALTNILQTSSPKYDALTSFIAANLCWWPSCNQTTSGTSQTGGTPPTTGNPPAVNIGSPANGTKLNGNGTVTIAASASDPNGIASIIIKGDSTTLMKCTSSTSCSAQWPGKNITRGTHVISATAINNAGMTGSASVTILSTK